MQAPLGTLALARRGGAEQMPSQPIEKPQLNEALYLVRLYCGQFYFDVQSHYSRSPDCDPPVTPRPWRAALLGQEEEDREADAGPQVRGDVARTERSDWDWFGTGDANVAHAEDRWCVFCHRVIRRRHADDADARCQLPLGPELDAEVHWFRAAWWRGGQWWGTICKVCFPTRGAPVHDWRDARQEAHWARHRGWWQR